MRLVAYSASGLLLWPAVWPQHLLFAQAVLLSHTHTHSAACSIASLGCDELALSSKAALPDCGQALKYSVKLLKISTFLCVKLGFAACQIVLQQHKSLQAFGVLMSSA